MAQWAKAQGDGIARSRAVDNSDRRGGDLWLEAAHVFITSATFADLGDGPMGQGAWRRALK